MCRQARLVWFLGGLIGQRSRLLVPRWEFGFGLCWLELIGDREVWSRDRRAREDSWRHRFQASFLAKADWMVDRSSGESLEICL